MRRILVVTARKEHRLQKHGASDGVVPLPAGASIGKAVRGELEQLPRNFTFALGGRAPIDLAARVEHRHHVGIESERDVGTVQDDEVTLLFGKLRARVG